MRHSSSLIAAATAALAAIGAAAAETPTPRFPGAGTTVAVERASGRVVVATDGVVRVLDSVDAGEPSSTFELPNAAARLLDFRGNVVSFTFKLPREEAWQFMAVGTDGLERLLWPNDGIGAHFPTAESRLTGDGRGLLGVLELDGEVRRELGVPAEAPDGAGVVVTYSFTTERMLIRFSEAFHDALALACDDLLISWRNGSMIRYRSPGGVEWKRDRVTGEKPRILDVEPVAGTALLLDETGTLAAVDVGSGEKKWGRPAGGAAVRDARVLRDGRGLLLLADPESPLAVFDPDRPKAAPRPLAELLEPQGLSAVAVYAASGSETLTGVREVTPTSGPRLLLRGPTGWHLAKLP
ncbi:MAG: hypothetical protein AB1625_16115 [Acidobacteriota bacterium]